MSLGSLVIVYHKDCEPSLELLKNVKELENFDIETIDIATEQCETEIKIDVVPILVVNNVDIFRGKDAFDKVNELIKTSNEKPKHGIMNRKSSVKRPLYSRNIVLPPPDDNTKKPVIDGN